MDLRAFAKVHALHTQEDDNNGINMLHKETVFSVNVFPPHRSRKNVMRAAVEQVRFADALVCEFNPLSRLISCKDTAHN